ncbi:MAG: phosphoglycerate kinase [bacterium]
MIKYIDQCPQDLYSKRVVLRVDYNVPIEEGKVKDSTRILESKKTIDYLLNLKCDIILLTHLGRPKTEEDKKKYTTRHVWKYLNESKVLSVEVDFIENFDRRISYQGGKVYLFENVRFFDGETKNNLELAKKFAEYGDFFVNDAFGSLHRVHSSVAGISEFLPTFFGFLVKHELENLSRFLRPEQPFTLILGGAKISDKLGLIKNIKAQNVIVGGATCLTIYKNKGKNIGQSFFEEIDTSEIELRITMPSDFIVVDQNYQNPVARNIDHIGDGIVVDAIPNELILEMIRQSRTIFWNGPMGIFEKGFTQGSLEILRALNQAKGFRGIGGGDTVRFFKEVTKSYPELSGAIDFISTGGGATLEFLENGTLQAIEYIKNKVQTRR